MFRIRRIEDDVSLADREAIAQIERILREQFPDWRPRDFERLAVRLRDSRRQRYRLRLLAVEDARGRVRAFALLLWMPDVGVAFLDLISTAPGATGSGLGAALYQRVREEAKALGARALLLECSVDDPAVVTDPQRLEQNRQRLKFYERYGVRPLADNAWDTPTTPGDRDLYYLLYDGLGDSAPPPRALIRAAARAILQRRYAHLFDAKTIARIVASFTADPVPLRPPRYLRRATHSAAVTGPAQRGIALVVNEGHEIHHVHDRGYVEAPVRIPLILSEIEKTGLFKRLRPRRAPDALLRRVHDPRLLAYLPKACAWLKQNQSIYPIIFPVRNLTRPPEDPELALGYYCTDTFTPLHKNAWPAARGAVDCAVTAAQALFAGYTLAYALVRPPGHHAERRAYGGFCYLNSAAVAAEYLSDYGRVAILDIDYHHGNGTQDIFYRRGDVLTISIHGAPPTVYPHFSGFADERGEAEGSGFNLNLPLPEKIGVERYRQALAAALRRLRRFAPAHLVVCLGLDTAKGDPTGTWPLRAGDFFAIGHAIGALRLPTVVVQEGGYRTHTLGVNARRFFEGLWRGASVRGQHT